MVIKLPMCPQCEELELYRLPGKVTKVKCYVCGWDSGVLGVDLDDYDEQDAIQLAVMEFRRTGNWNDEQEIAQ